LPGRISLIAVLLALYLAPSTFAQSATPPRADSSCSPQTWVYIGVGGAVLLTAVMFQYDQQIYDELYSFKMNNAGLPIVII
jgi:multisubunit Na+/H+ antiporter MnhB subunit